MHEAVPGTPVTATSTGYDLLGKVLHQTDPLGRTTTMAYDLMGRLISTAYPDGTAETRSYDAEARLLTQVDRSGRATDARGTTSYTMTIETA